MFKGLALLARGSIAAQGSIQPKCDGTVPVGCRKGISSALDGSLARLRAEGVNRRLLAVLHLGLRFARRYTAREFESPARRA